MKSRLELYWIPLGAGDGIGARVVRFSGGVYERLKALIQRPPQALFHAALVAETSNGRCVVEMTPVPRVGSAEERGVVGGGAVGEPWSSVDLPLRDPAWPDGVIPDIADAIDSPTSFQRRR